MNNQMIRFLDCYIPTETCNLRCQYCYIAQQRKFNNKICRIDRSPEEIRAAFSQERLGGACLINLCAGGETLLTPELSNIVRLLLDEGHYVMIVTNGTLTRRLSEFWSLPETLKNHLMFKFSFHYLEMIRLNMMEVFCDNVKKTQESGCSISVEVTPNDELIPYIEDLKAICMKKFGALCHVTLARNDKRRGIDLLTDLSLDAYQRTWGAFESEMFSTKMKLYQIKRKEFCYAGDWSFYVNLLTGNIVQCYCGRKIGNLYDLSKPLIPQAIGNHCGLAYCYNGHVFLTLGTIQGLNLPPFSALRDREMVDGGHWLSDEMRDFLSQKLCDNNEEYTSSRKWKADIKQLPYAVRMRIRRTVSSIRG